MARGRLRQASYYSTMAVSKLEALFNMMQEEDFATAASLYTIVLRMKLAAGELYDALDNGERILQTGLDEIKDIEMSATPINIDLGFLPIDEVFGQKYNSGV